MSKTGALRPEMLEIRPHAIADIARLAWAEGGVTPLFFGESDLVTPAFIRDAAKKALDDGKTFYGTANGLPDLREALRLYSERLYGIKLDPARVHVPGSAMLAIMMSLQCVVRTGDNVVLIAPVWPSIVIAAETAGAETRLVQLGRSDDGGWKFDLEALAAECDAKTKAIFVCSPCNPNGWVMTREEQQALLDFTRSRGIALIADEVYARIVYDGEAAPSFLQLANGDDLLFVINSFSKSWAMTGWRVGWLIAPEIMAGPLTTLSVVSNTGATMFAQYGALAAIEDPRGEEFVRFMRERCRRGRALVEEMARSSNRILPLRIDGSFYAYLEIDGVTDSKEFARRLVKEAKVGVAPGVSFGPGNESFVRLCFAQDETLLSGALERMMKVL